MAVAVAWRIAIALAPVAGGAGVRVLRWAEGPGVASADKWWHRFTDPSESDSDLEALLAGDGVVFPEVATYSGDFVLRKVQMIWSVQDAATAADDARVITFHLAKVSGGTVVDTWDGADFTLLDAEFSAFWSTMVPMMPTKLTLDRIKVYKAGPSILPPQPPVYDADKNVAGTQSTNPVMPPQVAISVTEKAGTKRYWGRFYFPGGHVGNADSYGRVDTIVSTALADATDTLYQDLKAGGLHPVVYRQALPERETKAGTTLPARAATAWDVESIQVDDVFDVIRSRRFKYPMLRTQRAIA